MSVSKEELDQLWRDATTPSAWFPSNTNPDSSAVVLVEPQLLQRLIRCARTEALRNEWRSVSESPPKLHQHCLIWIEGAQVACIGTLNKRHAHTYGSEIFYYFALANGAGERAADKVSHWMPLPSVPSPQLRSPEEKP